MKRFYRIVLVMAVSDSTKKFTWRYNRVIMWQIVQRKIRIIECWSPDAFTLSENDCSRNLFLAIIYPFTFHIPIVAKAPTAAYWPLWNQIHQSVKSVRFFSAAVLLHQCTPGRALLGEFLNPNGSNLKSAFWRALICWMWKVMIFVILGLIWSGGYVH